MLFDFYSDLQIKGLELGLRVRDKLKIVNVKEYELVLELGLEFGLEFELGWELLLYKTVSHNSPAF